MRVDAEYKERALVIPTVVKSYAVNSELPSMVNTKSYTLTAYTYTCKVARYPTSMNSVMP